MAVYGSLKSAENKVGFCLHNLVSFITEKARQESE